MRKHIPDEDKLAILEHFRTYGVNHTVFMMDYKYNADDVCRVIRERIVELEEIVNEHK